ncbi:MAG: polymer-forming cytoskeletal protein [candidate division WOR-3 bacterium]|nr:polymer-forming cytoskeletal protein [candidate division WOR-3 bacterium]
MFGKKNLLGESGSKHLDRLDSFIGKGTNFKGDLAVSGSAKIDGQIEGDIRVSEMVLTGPESFIKGTINCKDAVIGGRVEGNINAQGSVELQAGATVLGDIICTNLIIAKDCFFEGKCQMSGKETRKD